MLETIPLFIVSGSRKRKSADISMTFTPSGNLRNDRMGRAMGQAAKNRIHILPVNAIHIHKVRQPMPPRWGKTSAIGLPAWVLATSALMVIFADAAAPDEQGLRLYNLTPRSRRFSAFSNSLLFPVHFRKKTKSPRSSFEYGISQKALLVIPGMTWAIQKHAQANGELVLLVLQQPARCPQYSW